MAIHIASSKVCCPFVVGLMFITTRFDKRGRKIYRGVIPVVIDNSESMSVSDPYLEWQKLKLAAHLNLIEVDEADLHFEKRALAWNEILESSYKSPLWLSALVKIETPSELKEGLRPLLTWLNEVELQLKDELDALKEEQWSHKGQESESDLNQALKQTQQDLIKGQSDLAKQYKKLQDQIKTMEKSGVKEDALGEISFQLRQLLPAFSYNRTNG